MSEPDSIRTLVFMALLVVLSAYFSATETAFSAVNELRLKNLAENGNKRAKKVLRLTEQYDRLLSTILVGNNLVNIALTTLATVFFVNHYGENKGATVATVVSTVVVLIFGEISPKSLAKEHAEGFAMGTVSLLSVIMILLYPVNWLFSLWKKLLDRVFSSRETPTVTQEELLTLVDVAQQEGSLNEQESDLIHRVIDFNDRTAVDILIPRVDVAGIEADAPSAEMRKVFAETGFSRLPVYEETLDDIIGVVHFKDAVNGNATPRDIMQETMFVPPTVPIRVLLTQLQDGQCHMAIVSDEYGGTLGIVTMEDILEELVGEIWDEHDDVVETIRTTDRGETRVLCSEELTAFAEHFGVALSSNAQTVSGWVMECLGKIPEKGDTFTADGLWIRVEKMEQNRPEEILVRQESPAEQ